MLLADATMQTRNVLELKLFSINYIHARYIIHKIDRTVKHDALSNGPSAVT